MPVQWQKSSFSGVEGGNCVELAHYEGQILIRESAASAAVITTAPELLRCLLAALKPEP
ncbi:DUF397 domain-containing protein [Streptomyces sp. KM273126]|uniref:DUF397 domain-containing protein n=1 Tax=Streptomyces sp. KM273126 TaxID=2545247 RepID=UPI0026A5EE15|nr:DUF397 domain-containing protein [Streptomyces sp. KM273126]